MKSKIKLLFGTDGIRGIANRHPMDPLTLVRVGKALVLLLQEMNPLKNIKIVIGRDTRISGFMIESALAAGICSQGGQVRLIGEMPTPGIAFTTMSMRADAGIVISASHNPFQDNGVKIFSSGGYKISNEWEQKIEELVVSKKDDEKSPIGKMIIKAKSITDAPGRYTEFLKNTFLKNMTLKGLKIVLDCANGASYRVAPLVFEELDAELIVIHDEPDGSNINRHCGATAPHLLQQRVLQEKADVGIALDGDADRVILVDEHGKIRDGDTLMAICAVSMNEKQKLSKKSLVVTQMSNYSLELAMKRHKIRVVRTEVGDRFVVTEMRKHGYNLGGEQSGHVVFLDHTQTGDGVVSALQLLAVMQEKQKSLSELSKILKKTPQILLNIEIGEKKPLDTLGETSRKIQNLRKKLAKKGRILVRYSGTENLARVMIEGNNFKQIETYAQEIAESLRRELAQ